MTALQNLEAYLAALDRRLRLYATSRGLAVSILCALALTIVLTWIGNQYRFTAGLVLPLRLILFAGLACSLVFALGRPLWRINRRRTVALAESRTDFGQSLLTVTERGDTNNPFTELIAEDAMRVANAHPPEQFVPAPWLLGSAAAAIAAAAALFWLVTSAPGYWSYGASLLWTSAPRTAAPLYDIAVSPGNTTVRRHTDQVIQAQLKGFAASNVILHAKYHGGLKWDEVPMQAQPSGNGYQLLFAGLSDSLEYFVQAGASQSKHFTVSVKDLPAVKHMRVAIHFPEGIGLPDSVEDPGGDIRAVVGSKAEIRILTDKPLQNGVLVLENGTKLPLTKTGENLVTATLPIRSDGSYHIAALDQGETVRITDNYIIEARKDEAPSVSVVRPGKDAGVSPIEELPVAVNSSDDFGLRAVDLHYSVNGGPEQVKSLAKAGNAKQVEGKAVLPLEDFKLSPGDLVSFYATAKDATHTSRSDIVFAKVEPFDLKFRQSQQSGGGGGAGQQDTQISERQKEIIAATWNQLKDPAKERAALAQNAHFLAELESKLGEQAKTLSDRMKDRELGESSPQFQEFSKSMLEASAEMSQAVKQLQPGQWTGALTPEQKALQSLMHAESLFRDIQVSQGQQKGGGGSGGGQERDLARLFDLELDTAKNQYESGQSAAAQQNDTQKQMEQELEKLKELARRQQQLADEKRSPQQQFQQRWEEEQLRREAEELRQQMQQQLSQDSQSSQSQSGSQSQSKSQPQSKSQSQSQASGSAGSSAQRDALKQAMNSINKAEEEMRNASSHPDASAQQRAANQLAQAQEMMRNLQHQQASNGLSDLAEKAKQLAASQNDLGRRVKKLYGAEGVNTARTDEDGNLVMPEMNGPGYAGGYYRRRMQQSMPAQPATGEEKKLAEEGDKLADQMQQLQNQLHEQAQALSAQQPEATRKLRKALSDAEQEEIAVRMRKGSDWLRQGFGSKTWPVQDGITAATQQLTRQVEEARQASGKEQPGSEPGDGGSPGGSLGQALSQVRALREQLASQPGGRGGQQSAADQLAGLRSRLGGDDRQLNGSFNEAIGSLRQMNAQAGLLDARLNHSSLVSLERLEVELARRMNQKAGARASAAENVPESYRDAVATYFKALSQ